MRPLKIALIVLAVIILTPLVLAQGVVLYLVATDHAAEVQSNKDELATLSTSAARDCVSMKQNRPSAWDIGDEKYREYLNNWLETCQREAAAGDAAPAVQLALFKA